MPEAKRKLRLRWKSIKKYAKINMAYGAGGSYGDGDKVSPCCKKDERFIELIDEILTEVLKD